MRICQMCEWTKIILLGIGSHTHTHTRTGHSKTHFNFLFEEVLHAHWMKWRKKRVARGRSDFSSSSLMGLSLLNAILRFDDVQINFSKTNEKKNIHRLKKKTAKENWNTAQKRKTDENEEKKRFRRGTKLHTKQWVDNFIVVVVVVARIWRERFKMKMACD